jgi:hypothetical protein
MRKAVPERNRRGVALGVLRRGFSGARPERNGFRATITATPWKQPRLSTLGRFIASGALGEPQPTHGQTDQAFHHKFAHRRGQRNAAPLRSRLPTRPNSSAFRAFLFGCAAIFHTWPLPPGLFCSSPVIKISMMRSWMAA